jgi:DNA invertase Pin-like site-specific DNA recombinase
VNRAHKGHSEVSFEPAAQSKIAESKARQIIRIRELGSALAADGLVTLDEQARALGLSRSTAWAILKANHKSSGLAAGTINQMLSQLRHGRLKTSAPQKHCSSFGNA